jgi:hypothetical protein
MAEALPQRRVGTAYQSVTIDEQHRIRRGAHQIGKTPLVVQSLLIASRDRAQREADQRRRDHHARRHHQPELKRRVVLGRRRQPSVELQPQERGAAGRGQERHAERGAATPHQPRHQHQRRIHERRGRTHPAGPKRQDQGDPNEVQQAVADRDGARGSYAQPLPVQQMQEHARPVEEQSLLYPDPDRRDQHHRGQHERAHEQDRAECAQLLAQFGLP